MDNASTTRRVSSKPSVGALLRCSTTPSPLGRSNSKSLGEHRNQRRATEFSMNRSPGRRSRPTASDFFEEKGACSSSEQSRNTGKHEEEQDQRRSIPNLTRRNESTFRDDDRDSDGINSPPEAVIRLTRDQSLRAPFPQGCPVFVSSEDGCSNRMGEVSSVSVSFQCGTGQLVDLYDVLLCGGGEASGGKSGLGEKMTVPGTMLKYAPGCPVHIKRTGTPQQQAWMQGTVIGSCEIPSIAGNCGQSKVAAPQSVLYSVQLSFDVHGSKVQRVDLEHGVSATRLRFRPSLIKAQERNENEEKHDETRVTLGNQTHHLDCDPDSKSDKMEHVLTALTDHQLDQYDSATEQSDIDEKSHQSKELATIAADSVSQNDTESTMAERARKTFSDMSPVRNTNLVVKEEFGHSTSAQGLQQVKRETDDESSGPTTASGQFSDNEVAVEETDPPMKLPAELNDQPGKDHLHRRSNESKGLSSRWTPPELGQKNLAMSHPTAAESKVSTASASTETANTSKRPSDPSCEIHGSKKKKVGYCGTLFVPRPAYSQKDVIDAVIGPPLRAAQKYLLKMTGCQDITVNCSSKEFIAVRFTHESERDVQMAANILIDHIVGKMNNVADRNQLRKDMRVGEITSTESKNVAGYIATASVQSKTHQIQASPECVEIAPTELAVSKKSDSKAGYRGYLLVPKKYGQENIKGAVIGPERRVQSFLVKVTGCTQIVLMLNRRDYGIVRFTHHDREGAQDAGFRISDHLVRAMSHCASEAVLRRDVIIDSVAPANSPNRWTDQSSPMYVPQLTEQGNIAAQEAGDEGTQTVPAKHCFRGKILVPKYVGQKHMQESFIGEGRDVHRALLGITGCRHLKFLPNPPDVPNHFVVDFSHESRQGAALAGAIFCNHIIKSVTNAMHRKQLRIELRSRIFSYTWEDDVQPGTKKLTERDGKLEVTERTADTTQENDEQCDLSLPLYIPDWIHTDILKGICLDPAVLGKVKVKGTADGIFLEGDGLGGEDEKKMRMILEDLLLNSVEEFQKGRALYEMACSQSTSKSHCKIVHQREPEGLGEKVWMSVLNLPSDTDRRHNYLLSLVGTGGDLTKLQIDTSCKIGFHGQDIWGTNQSDAKGYQPYILVAAKVRESVESDVSAIKQRLHELRHKKSGISVASSGDNTLL